MRGWRTFERAAIRYVNSEANLIRQTIKRASTRDREWFFFVFACCELNHISHERGEIGVFFENWTRRDLFVWPILMGKAGARVLFDGLFTVRDGDDDKRHYRRRNR